MNRVLVTGAGGFIGRHTLQPLIDRGYEVHAVTSKTPLSPEQAWTWHVTNLLDPLQIRHLIISVQPTHLLHLAWCTTPGVYWTSQENFRWTQASLELLQQFKENRGQRVVIAGTCAEYDWNYGYCSESVTPLNPHTPYGICKNALQEMFASYCTQTGLSGGWGRIFFAYGAYEHPQRLIPSVILALLKQETAHCSHGKQLRDFLYVQDVADAFVAFLLSDVTGSVNIASGQSTQLKDIIYQIANQFDRPELIRLGEKSVPASEPNVLIANNHRLINEVQWHPRYNLETGIRATIDWWKKQEAMISNEI